MVFIKRNVKDNAEGQLQVSITSTATTIQLKTGDGAKLPPAPFIGTSNARIDGVIVKYEEVKVTDKTGDTLTVERGFGDTIPQGFDADDFFSCFVVAEHIRDIQEEVESLGSTKANDSAVVHKTGDETIAGVKTYSSSPIVPTPTTDYQASTKKYVDDAIATFGNENMVKTLTAGQILSVGEYFRSGISGNFLDIASNGGVVDVGGGIVGIGRDATSQAMGVAIPVETSGGLVQVTASLLKTGTPTSQITMTLYSNLPGTTVVATSTNTISEASLTGSASTQTFTFSNEAVVKGTTYYAKLSVPRANSSTNYTKWVGLSTTPDNMYYVNSANAWTLMSGARANYSLTINPGEVSTKKYKAYANKSPFNKVEGAVGSPAVVDGDFSGIVGGIVGGYTGLTTGEISYLKDDGTVGSTPGTTNIKVGRNISTTAINFVPPL